MDIETRKKYLLDLGLTETEFEYITAPFSKLNAEQKNIALAIWAKRNSLMAAQNELYRAEQAAAEAARLEAEAEHELDDEDVVGDPSGAHLGEQTGGETAGLVA